MGAVAKARATVCRAPSGAARSVRRVRAAVFFDVDGTLVPQTSSAQYLAGFLGHLETLRGAENLYGAGRMDNGEVARLDAAGWRGRTPDQVATS